MSNPTSKISIIFSGETVTGVKMLDGTETVVRVRAMPARRLVDVLAAADAEANLIELVSLIPSEAPDQEFQGFAPVAPGWADNLTDESHLALYEAAKRQNFSRAASWAERQIAAKKYSGEIALRADEALRPLMQQILSMVGSLQRSPGSPAAATRKS